MDTQIPETPIQHSWGDEAALNELQHDVQSPEDQAYLDEVDKQLGDSLQSSLGHDAVKLVQLQDGTVTTEDAVRHEREAGHDMTSTFSGGRTS